MSQYVPSGLHCNSDELGGDEAAKISEAESAGYLKSYDFTEDNRRYHIKSGYILREIAGEHAIIPVDTESLITNAIMVPNDTAVFFWNAFQQPSTIEDVVRKGMDEYEVTEDVIRDAAQRFVNDTLRYRILEEDK